MITGADAAVDRAYEAAIERWNGSPQGPAFPQSARPVQRRQLELLVNAAAEGELVIDVGTGPGLLPATLLALGRRVLTTDLPGTGHGYAATWIRELGGRAEEAMVGPDPIPAESDSASAVLVADVIEHLPGSPLPLLAEIRRVLKPGGICVLTTPNATRIHTRLKLLVGRSNWPPLEVVYGPDLIHPSHHREYTRADLLRVLSESGFAPVAVEMMEERLHRLPRAGRALSSLVSRVTPNLSGDMIATAVKSGHEVS